MHQWINHLHPDDPAVIAGREAVKDWPPLSPEQVEELTVIFTGSLADETSAA